jgi:L-cystine uptake protein TcyP (sodium:dicarboxylate symporter family)
MKLIVIVETGKQMLTTHRSLTTFSIAADLAKYFAVIPAVFAATYPALNALNVARLTSARSAILSAVIFNSLIIVPLLLLAVRGVKARAESAALLSRLNLWIYGLAGILLPVGRHQADRRLPHCTQARMTGALIGPFVPKNIFNIINILRYKRRIYIIIFPWLCGPLARATRDNRHRSSATPPLPYR